MRYFTKEIEKEIEKEIKRLEDIIKVIDLFQKSEPKGRLYHQKIGDKVYFYCQSIDASTGKWKKKYIKKSDLALVRSLAQKQYYAAIKPIMEKSLKALKYLLKNYHPEQSDNVYDKLSVERRELITPIPGSKEERIRKWNEEHQKQRENTGFEVYNEFYPEGLKYATEQGEYVRSKSEVIIANVLYLYRDDLMYVYEWPLDLRKGNRIITIHPDFKVMNVHTGKTKYWEHAGMMDNQSYASDFVKKVNTYAANNLLVGRDVICTYETAEIPLDTSVIKKIVEDLL